MKCSDDRPLGGQLFLGSGRRESGSRNRLRLGEAKIRDEGLAALINPNLGLGEMLDLVMKCGQVNLRTMELLDAANTGAIPALERGLAGCLIARVSRSKPRGDITYSRDVAAILNRRCVECHRDGQIAPFALTRYEDIAGWEGMIAEVVPAGGATRCLEVGPGTGADLARLRRLGWAVVEGLDIDAEAAGRAAARSGCPVHIGHLGSFQVRERFDLIYASHSFEHLPSVLGSIVAMRGLLAPSGRIVLVLPNVDSLTTRRDRRHSVTVDAPRHLVLPPARALRWALEDGGFYVEQVRTTARRTAHYRAIARARRRGARGPEAWAETPSHADRAAQWAVRGLCALRVPLGEELVVVARKAG